MTPNDIVWFLVIFNQTAGTRAFLGDYFQQRIHTYWWQQFVVCVESKEGTWQSVKWLLYIINMKLHSKRTQRVGNTKYRIMSRNRLNHCCVIIVQKCKKNTIFQKATSRNVKSKTHSLSKSNRRGKEGLVKKDFYFSFPFFIYRHWKTQGTWLFPLREMQVKAAWKLIRGYITTAAGPEPLSLSAEVNKVLSCLLLWRAR